MFDKHTFWCCYCKDKIQQGERYEKDDIGNRYHKECWKLLKEEEDDIYL